MCSAIKRVYVPESIYDDVVDGLAAQAAAVKVGDGTERRLQARARSTTPRSSSGSRSWWATRSSHGARAATGGQAMDRPGYFFEPTILTGLSRRDPDRRRGAVRTGPAGDLLPGRRRRRRAGQRHPFRPVGLGVGQPTADRAADVAGQLECGTAWVNTHLALAPQQPFGGFKWSGVGVENGPWGLAEFSEIQAVHRSKSADGLNLNTGGLVS